MVKATLSDKSLVVDILSRSFESNQSVNYIIPQDASKSLRIRRLMDYSFDVCHTFGQIFLSDDRKACALVLLPDRKRTNFKSVYLDLKLILSCVGLTNLKKTLGRESKIKQIQPQELMYYLWFIGVDPQCQNGGIGSKLLKEVIEQGTLLNRSVFLETSTLKNLPWYNKFGFEVYHELDLGYKLFFLERPLVAEKI
jgi:GNAT superfamily N-acetyltransferase